MTEIKNQKLSVSDILDAKARAKHLAPEQQLAELKLISEKQDTIIQKLNERPTTPFFVFTKKEIIGGLALLSVLLLIFYYLGLVEWFINYHSSAPLMEKLSSFDLSPVATKNDIQMIIQNQDTIYQKIESLTQTDIKPSVVKNSTNPFINPPPTRKWLHFF
jgi:hypothetical protein